MQGSSVSLEVAFTYDIDSIIAFLSIVTVGASGLGREGVLGR